MTAHGEFGPVGVTAPQAGQAANIGGGIIDLFALHGILIVATVTLAGSLVILALVARKIRPDAADLHRRGRAEIGTGRHRRHLAGIEDIGSRTGRTGAAWSNIANHRNGRYEYVLDDLAHGAVETTRCIHAQDDQYRVS